MAVIQKTSHTTGGVGHSNKSAVTKVIKSFTDYLDKYEDQFVIEEGDPRRYFFLRPSSFPYCGFRKLLDAKKEIGAERVNTFSSTYFTQVGHTTHAVFQAFGALGGRMVGDWQCKACDKWRRFSCDNICECGRQMHYHELEIKYKGIVVGHIDNLFRLDPKMGKKSPHVMVDYKTTSQKKVSLKPHLQPFPYMPNVHQIESYVPLTEAQFGISVDYWLLVYLARDAPFKWGRALRGKHLSDDDKAVILKRIDRWVKTHRLVLQAKSKEHFERVERRKLCKNKEDYEANFKEEFNPCPHAGKCFTDPESLIATARKTRVYPIIEHAPKKIQRQLLGGEDDGNSSRKSKPERDKDR